LGGKASATNRGQNLKAFIKEGRDQCNISVKIKNQGSAAYRPDTYGKSIIVERHFNRAGTSGFKLRDMNGKVVSTKRQDLEDIIDAFALQIDNPMNVLTQDMARQFLNDSTPKDKYKFFLKGTQLETLQADYRLIMTELEEMESKSQTVKTDVESLKKRFETARDKAKAAENLETMKVRERTLAHQAAWSRVEEEEEGLNKIDGEIERIDRMIDDRNATADEQSAAYENANQAYSDQNQNKEDKEAELGPLQEEVDGCNGQWNETKAKLLRIKVRYKTSNMLLLLIGSRLKNGILLEESKAR
jgi:chromosome segregation ATPase